MAARTKDPEATGATPASGGGRRLVIVESAAKAKTIGTFLGPGWDVQASYGHIRDLPSKAAELPESHPGRRLAITGVDVDNDFTPVYLVSPRSREVVTRLKRALKDADELYLATDEDREGEAIAWHLLEELKPKRAVTVRRMVFHEITRDAIARAVEDTRDLDMQLVDAQETRRILDRLYGYRVSPVLWRRIGGGLSAGRVQSVATRLLVQRERERMAFVSAGYWGLTATLAKDAAGAGSPTFRADLVEVDGLAVATGRDFDQTGSLRKPGAVTVLDETRARALAAGLVGRPFRVDSVTEKPYRRSPAAPFVTSTLQQEASRKLGWGARQTMQVAQRLYEAGFITYMRTDSVSLSQTATSAARAAVAEHYGKHLLPPGPRTYKSKIKNAQEAHEAIRPAGETFRTPAATRLSGPELRLYELVWQRTLASQMVDAQGTTVTVRMVADALDAEATLTRTVFSASGTVLSQPGFRSVYIEGNDDDGADAARSDGPRLPALAKDDLLSASEIVPDGHATTPPARFTEASLVKELEQRGIGRPSTFASIISTIQDKKYAFSRGKALVPSLLAFAVVQLLERNYERLVDYDFTARMEEDLDRIAGGQMERVAWLDGFWFGSGDEVGLLGLTDEEHVAGIDSREVSTITLPGTDVVARVGRYGPYLERPGTVGKDGKPERANVPEDVAPDELTPERVDELFRAGAAGDRVLGTDPATGLPVVARSGRFGPYVTLAMPDPDAATVVEPGATPEDGAAGVTAGGPDGPETPPARPAARKPAARKTAAKKKEAVKAPTASLLSSMSLETVTLDDALALLTLPRTVGVRPADGEDVVVANGRYGPYVRCGTDTRTLPDESLLLTIGLDDALAVLAQPRTRRGAKAASPGREVGPDPVSGAVIRVKDGQWGPYVTDGEVNATISRGIDPETIDVPTALELLAARRARIAAGGGTRATKTTKAATTKTAATKATPSKATATKSATAKAATTKTAGTKAAGTKAAAATTGAASTTAKAATVKSATTKAATKKTTSTKAATSKTAATKTTATAPASTGTAGTGEARPKRRTSTKAATTRAAGEPSPVGEDVVVLVEHLTTPQE